MRHPGTRMLLEQQAELQSQTARLSAKETSDSGDEGDAKFKTAQEDESVRRGIDKLMARLVAHEKQVSDDQGGPGGTVRGKVATSLGGL
eukprot:7949413-Pyramimonas_sp.AAC.1